MTMSATTTSEKTIALGTSRRGSETSSAMSPALSKPMKLQPMSATAASIAPNDAPVPSTAGPSKIAENGCSRKKNRRIVPMTMRADELRAEGERDEELQRPRPEACSTPVASEQHHDGEEQERALARVVDPQQAGHERRRGVALRGHEHDERPHVRPARRPADARARELLGPLVEAAGQRPHGRSAPRARARRGPGPRARPRSRARTPARRSPARARRSCRGR